MDKFLFVSPHGLGDMVMLTPALRKFKEKNSDTYVTVAGLERFGKTLVDLLSGLSFIDEVVTILPDAWRDGPDQYDKNIEEVIKVADQYGKENQYKQGVYLPTARQDGYRLHKIFRFESEVGVNFSCLEDLQTELSVTREANKRAKDFLKGYNGKVLLLHNNAGNPPKEFTNEEIEKISSNFTDYNILEFGKEISYDDMEFSKALIKNADKVVAIDSVVMHIAGAFKTSLVALFKSTPVHQALPLTYNIHVLGLDNEITQLQRVSQYKYLISETYGYPKFETDSPIILEGMLDGSVTDVVSMEIDNSKYKNLQFEVEKHDGPIRMTIEEHGEDAIKFLNVTLNHLPKPEDLPAEVGEARILDMGCNTGYNTKMLGEKYGKATGIDINPELIKASKKNWKQCRVMDIHEMTFKKDTFDLIFAKDVLEHSHDPSKVLNKMFRILKQDGKIVAFIPMDGEVSEKPFVDFHMSRGYTPHLWKTTFEDCKEKFELAGFSDIVIHKYKISDITGKERPFGNHFGIVTAVKS